MTFAEEKKAYRDRIEAVLTRYLPQETGPSAKVAEAVNYSVRVGGKRLRPMLMLLCYELFGGDGPVIEPFLAAIEMIHTYSLVHDDLPAMDNDLLRRGKPTTHAEFGEAIAILTGDALLNLSIETAMNAFLLSPTEANKIAAAISVLYRKSGINGMIGGQTVDILTDGTGEVTSEELDYIYRLKTGALLEASMMIGALLAGAKEKEIETIETVAEKIGLAFQIKDDILDVVSTEEELGKPVGSDTKNEKATYVTYEGVAQSEEDVKRLTTEALALLDTLPGEKDFLTELLRSLTDRRS